VVVHLVGRGGEGWGESGHSVHLVVVFLIVIVYRAYSEHYVD